MIVGDMNEYKKLAYKLEDTFSLGKSLPVVAMRQLPKIAKDFEGLQDIESYLPKTNLTMCKHINHFVEKNKRLMDDERELRDVFVAACKRGHYGARYLSLFERRI